MLNEKMTMRNMKHIICTEFSRDDYMFSAEKGGIVEFYEKPEVRLTIGASVEKDEDGREVVIFNLFYKGEYVNIPGALKTENGKFDTDSEDFKVMLWDLCKEWNKLQIVEGFTHDSLKFRYQLLDRMRSDCEYFLGYGGRNEKHLWGTDIESHIYYMKVLWNMFKDKEKPEWLTMEQINDYERRMK